ncbi:DUF6455 family protein [Litorivita sp. NS0012-18]|uniref:DUF6455 family protein n=1 Tax=Litorivita sp. NS0012-18 TaxID=3127655 RepID=UPI00333FBBCA
MTVFTKLSVVSQRVAAMAERVGAVPQADSDAAMDWARSYRGAVLRCNACTDTQACAQWQNTHAQADTAPDYCRNKAMFDGLK